MYEYKTVCEPITGNGYTSLGIGDILIPGICINYSLIFDLSSSNRYGIYFFVNIAGINFFFHYYSAGTEHSVQMVQKGKNW